MTTSCLVLLVEDDEDIRDVISVLLREFGYDVISAKHGVEALARLRSADRLPCVILLDLWMPVMDGWKFREEQQKDAALAAIPVVALSGAGEARGFDAAAHLQKPVQFDPLVSTVERFCGRALPPS